MNIQDLEKKKKVYEDLLAQSQQAEGERKQIQLDKESLQKELEASGFKNKAELEGAIANLEKEIIDSQTKLDKFVVI